MWFVSALSGFSFHWQTQVTYDFGIPRIIDSIQMVDWNLIEKGYHRKMGWFLLPEIVASVVDRVLQV